MIDAISARLEYSNVMLAEVSKPFKGIDNPYVHIPTWLAMYVVSLLWKNRVVKASRQMLEANALSKQTY